MDTIAIENEAGDSNGGDVYFITMQITFWNFRVRNEICIVT